MSLTISSSAFRHNADIPARYTCDDEDMSPPLSWTGVPAGAKSLVLIVDDPDAPDPKAPKMTWVHWVLYNMPAATRDLPAAVPLRQLPGQTLAGKNDWGRTGYGGPCPPVGRHRYFFTLFALGAMLPDLHQPTRAQLEQAMAGHVLAQAVLMGTYQKAR